MFYPQHLEQFKAESFGIVLQKAKEEPAAAHEESIAMVESMGFSRKHALKGETKKSSESCFCEQRPEFSVSVSPSAEIHW